MWSSVRRQVYQNGKYPNTNWDYKQRYAVSFALRRRKYLQVRAQEKTFNQDKTKDPTKNIYANSLQLTTKSPATKTDRPAELTEGTLLLGDQEVTR